MFKLLDCNNFWSPSGGGVRRYHLEKIAYFKDRTDVEYVFIMHDDKTYSEQIGPKAVIEHLKVPKVMGNWEYRYLLKKGPIEPVICKHDPDVIEVGSPYFMPAIINKIIAKNDLKSKVFGFWHADYPVTYIKRFLSNTPVDKIGEQLAWKHARKHYNRMDGVLVASELIRKRMEENGVRNTHFIPLGVNKDLFHPRKLDTSLRDQLKAGEKERLILFFPHRFSKEKGLHLLLEAYDLLIRQLDHEPTLILAGTGPYQSLVEKAADKYEHVHFIGFIHSKDEMAAYYASADLGFALSAWETFGLSLLEALSCGLPLIAANDGAAMEHINYSDAGIIVEQLDARSIANAVCMFVDHPSRQAMNKKARMYAEGLSWKECFDAQLALYKAAVEN